MLPHNDASIVLVLHESVVQPNELLVFTYSGEVCFLKSLECSLKNICSTITPGSVGQWKCPGLPWCGP